MDHGFSRMRRIKRGFFRGDPLHPYVPWSILVSQSYVGP